MALNVANIVKLEKVVEPVKEPEPQPALTKEAQKTDEGGGTTVRSAFKVGNLVVSGPKVEPVKEPVKEPEQVAPPPPTRRTRKTDGRGFTVVRSALQAGNLIVGNSKVDLAEQAVRQLKQEIDGKEKLKMSYFLIPKDSDYMSHNVKHNRR